MSHHQSIGHRSLTRLLVLLVLVASLAPANVRSAADDTGVIPKTAVDAALWKANWRQKYPGAQAVEELIFDAFHYQLTLANPDDQAHIRQALGQFRRGYETARSRGQDASYHEHQSYDEIVRTMIDVASTLPTLHSAVSSVWALMVNPNHSTFPLDELDAAAKIAAGTRSYGVSPEALDREESTLQTIFEAATQFPSFAAAYDQEHSATLGASIKGFDAVHFLQARPDFPVPLHIRQGIQPSGALPISVTDIQALSRSEFSKLNASIDVLRATVVTIDAAQGTLLEYMKDQQKQQEMRQRAEATASQEKRNLDAIKTSLAVLSTLGGKLDPKFGKQLSVLTTSGVQVGEALNKWQTAVAKLKGVDKVGNLSTVIMTGNVLGAVMNVVSLFGPSQPTPEQMILQEIGKLRQQVGELRQEMHSRFDRLDQELNAIYTTMQDRFNLIDLQLGKINGNVQEIQKSLIAIDLTLSRIERNNFAFLDAEGRRPLLSAINGAIGYRERTGVDMPYQPDFVQHENEFHSWGTIFAFDALGAGPPDRDFRDGLVLGELQALPLDSNINYLNGWLTAHRLAPFANARLASPRDWTFASRAYTDMGVDWPEHLRRVNAERLATLDQVGSDLETAIRHISTRETPTGPQGNKPLFTGVMAYYNSKLDVLDASIPPVETAYLHEVQTARLHRAEPFDLFGGMDQSLPYQAPELREMRCGGRQATLPLTDPPHFLAAPANLITFMPHFNRYNLAEYLKLGTLKACVDAELLAPIESIECGGPNGCNMRGKVQVSVHISFGGVTIASPTFTTQGKVVISGESDAMEYALSHWGTFRSGLERYAVDHPSPEVAAKRAAHLRTTTDSLHNTLASYQRELYGKISNELIGGGLRPVAVELGGSKLLLDDFIILGLPRAVAHDDFLRSLLFGTQRVIDDTLAADIYARSAAQPITEAQLTTNTRLVLGQVAAQRRTALQDLLNEYLDAISAGTHVEELNFVANTRLELRLSRRLAEVAHPRVFPPLVER